MHFDPADERSLARRDFLKVGVPATLVSMLLATAYILVRYA